MDNNRRKIRKISFLSTRGHEIADAFVFYHDCSFRIHIFI